MEKEFIPYEQALALKELGFDEPCVAFYEQSKKLSIGFNWLNEGGKNSNLQECTAPLYQQAFRFFREKYKSNFIIGFGNDGGYYRIGNLFSKWYKTYEEAELECLKKLIEIVK